ncbi:MAG: hypothetical protein D6748_04020 [Calditrichaeota bacterium]|nr:MAG: hypothetical protein D6748_04020 [Calditrichota bacterium]
MKNIIIALMLIGLFSNFVFSQKESGGTQLRTDVTGVGTNAATFLEIGVGARAMAMGGAYVAVANDPTALYYNPAGIVWMENIQVELMHNEWLVGTNYEFIGATTPLPIMRSSLGFSLILLDYGEQPVRTVERPEGTGETYGARDYAVSLTYALALTPNFSFGMSGKYINQKIWHESGGALALDFGIFYRTPVRGLRLGMSVRNFGGEISLTGRELDSTKDPDPDNENIDRVPVQYKADSYPLPLLFKAGIAYTMDWGGLGEVTITSDVNHPSLASESVNIGMEYGYAGIFFLRAGYDNLFDPEAINGLTLGGGVDYYQPGRIGFRIDYAYSDWGPFQSTHRFSLGIIFD